MAITVFVVDDQELVREGIVQIIAREPEMKVVGQGGGSLDTLDTVRRLKPQIIVFDLDMPRMRGVDFIERAKQGARTRAVACTTRGSYGCVADALRRGADGYLLKTSSAGLLIDAIRSVAGGDGFIDPGLHADVIRLLQGRDQELMAAEPTAGELEVLRFAAEGMSNQEIARRTHQSLETVKLRLRRSFQKLGAADRANAVALAMRRGLI